MINSIVNIKILINQSHLVIWRDPKINITRGNKPDKNTNELGKKRVSQLKFYSEKYTLFNKNG